MVHIPDENDPAPPPRPAPKSPLPGKPGVPPQRPATGENKRPPTGEARIPTGEAKRPPTGEQPVRKTGPVKMQPGSKTPTRPGNPPGAPRATQMLSLEPPKRNKGPSLAKDVRIDALGGPKTISQRNKNLMGNIGREKTQIMQRQPGQPPAQPPLSGEIGRPSLKKPGDSGRAVDLGAQSRQEMETMMRRKATRRIPKPGGGFMSDDAPLASMESGRMAPVAPGAPAAPAAPRQPQDPAARINVPPRVDIPIPQGPGVSRKQDVAPPPLSSRANTLAGVSAEDLLGDEGRRVLEDMRRREAEARARGDYRDTRRVRQGGQAAPIHPGTQDSQRRGFADAGLQQPAPVEPAASDELAPQNFLSGPTAPQNVVQTPQPVYEEVVDTTQPPPPDDLGYEKPVDFGDAGGGQGAYAPAADGGTEENPVARESQAHDEMEQRAGYLLWLQGVITSEEVVEALNQSDAEEPVRELLLNTGFADQVTLYRFLARHESLAPVDLSVVTPSQRALATLRPAIARAYRVIPIAKLGEILLVAAAFPFDPRRLLELRRLTASKVKLYVATEEEIDAALEQYYGGSGKPAVAVDDSDESDVGSDDSVTGEGEALAQKYDPTLSGEDSGLYAPQDENAPPPAADVGLAELDYDGGGVGSDSGRVDRPVRSNVRDTLDDAAIAASGDLDESTLEQGAGATQSDDELDLGAPPAEDSNGGQEDEGAPDSEDSGIDTGPEDHDPFKE
ncbi:MAG: hypothetical protein KF754_10090 [Planctomycetes bacterium]|nr:hypothetical protein [Planctomycetota bacterium]